METSIDSIISFLACIVLGLIPASIKPINNDEDISIIDSIIKKYAIKYSTNYIDSNIRTTAINLEISDACNKYTKLPEISSSDIAFIQFSSGSTSDPKPVIISHGALLNNITSIVKIDKRSIDSQGFNLLPLCHDMGLVGGLLSNFFYGNSLLLVSIEIFLRNPMKYLYEAHKRKSCVTAMPNFVLQYLTKYLRIKISKGNTSPIFEYFTSVYCGAEPIRRKTIKDFIDLSEKFSFNPSGLIFCYGMAETVLITTHHRFVDIESSFSSGDNSYACVGKPIDGISLEIINKDLHGVGEICVSGKSLFSGYNLPIKKSEYDFFETGDIGYIISNSLYITGRKKDIIISNGKNIHSCDIENYLSDNIDHDEIIVIPNHTNYDIVITSKKNESNNISAEEISKLLIKRFEIKADNIYFLPRSSIIKTSSGKPIKYKIIEAINNIEYI
jgi:acyl-CoA synthetase (AMP-forming)/AMP-acid ligase II